MPGITLMKLNQTENTNEEQQQNTYEEDEDAKLDIDDNPDDVSIYNSLTYTNLE